MYAGAGVAGAVMGGLELDGEGGGGDGSGGGCCFRNENPGRFDKPAGPRKWSKTGVLMPLQQSMLFVASSGGGCWQAAPRRFELHSCSSYYRLIDIATWEILEYRIGKVALAQRTAGQPLQHFSACRGITRGTISGSCNTDNMQLHPAGQCVFAN